MSVLTRGEKMLDVVRLAVYTLSWRLQESDSGQYAGHVVFGRGRKYALPADAKSRRFSCHTVMRRSGSHPGPGFPLDARDLPVQAWCSRLF